MTQTVSTVTDMKQYWSELIVIKGTQISIVTTVERKATMQGIVTKIKKGRN